MPRLHVVAMVAAMIAGSIDPSLSETPEIVTDLVPPVGPDIPSAPAKPAASPPAAEYYQEYVTKALTGADTPTLVRAMSHYQRALMQVQRPLSLNEFDENETVSFVYNVGDVDGDGVDDAALDVLCVTIEGCSSNEGGCRELGCVPEIRLQQDAWCRTPHRIFLYSGINGTEIWRRALGFSASRLPLSNPADPLDQGDPCFLEMVIGKAPSPDGGDSLIVYRFEGDRSGSGHQFYMVDRLSGNILWTTPRYPVLCVLNTTCQNLFVNPILQVAPEGGARIVPADTQPAFLIQGVGFIHHLGLFHPDGPEETGGRALYQEYQPIEWAASINLQTGAENWHVDTFRPYDQGMETSVYPWAIPGEAPVIYPTLAFFGDILATSAYYWNYVPCCFDLNGDHIPDMVYFTTEWSNRPDRNEQGPYFVRIRLVTFDGSSGDRLWEKIIEPGTARYMTPELSRGNALRVVFDLVGDPNGDGRSDIMIHRTYYQFDPRDIIEVYSGPTGDKLWSYESTRRVKALPIGDADGDKGTDVLVVDWFGWQHIGPTRYDYYNLTARPIILLSGLSGAALWREWTYSSPTDLVFLINSFRLNGVPDLDGDGAGEFPADDLVVLPDLTVVHRWRFLGGQTGATVHTISTVGQFSVPSYAGNLVGSPIDDVSIVSGDITDLWITIYDGATGEPSWSRRMMTPKLTEYLSAFPLVHSDPVVARDGHNYTLVDFHLVVMNCGGFFCTQSTNPQVASYAGRNGTSAWAYPRFWDANVSFRVYGATPASAAFARLVDDMGRPVGYAAATKEHARLVGPALGVFALSFLVLLGVGRLRWWNK